MLKKRLFCAGLALFIGLSLCGCEEVIDLTDEEEKIIVNYAAHLITKYNITGPEGYRFVLELPEEEEPEETDETEETEEELFDENGNPIDPTVAVQPEEEPEAPEIPASEAFANALGLSGMSIVYTGTEFTDLYETVYPEADNRLMVLHFTLENITDETRDANILASSPVFRASLNGGSALTADMTILADDLSTFMGTLEAGETRELALVFQIPAMEADTVETLVMQLIVGGKTTRIILQ